MEPSPLLKKKSLSKNIDFVNNSSEVLFYYQEGEFLFNL
jgi:hypothetical protein